MARLGATGRKCHPSLLLVLEHCRKRADVPVFYFPARPSRHTGLPSKLAYLYSQFDADTETQVRFHRCCTLATSTRNGLVHCQWRILRDSFAALRLRFFGGWFGGLRFLFFRLTHYRRDCLKFLAVAEVHEFYAHRVAAGLANFFDPSAHHLTFVCD